MSQSTPTNPSAAENHITTNAHAAQGQDEISFEKGVIVKVLEKRLDGWWKVDYGGRVGFAPAIFLQRYTQEVDESSKSTAIYMVPSVLDVQQSVGGASGKGEGPTAKPRVGKVNEKLQKPKSVESSSSSSRLETQTVSSPKLRQTGSSSVTRSAAMATANVSSLSKAPTSPTHKSSKPQRPPQPFIKQSSHEGEQQPPVQLTTWCLWVTCVDYVLPREHIQCVSAPRYVLEGIITLAPSHEHSH